MKFLGRHVIPTTLDPLPRPLRALPGVIAISHLELEALARDDGGTFKMLADIVRAEDAADARFAFRPVAPRRRVRLDPSARLRMLAAIGAGERRR
jgi:hypothetical protein